MEINLPALTAIVVLAALIIFLLRQGKTIKNPGEKGRASVVRCEGLDGANYLSNMDELINESRQSISRLDFLAKNIGDKELSARIRNICNITARILQDAARKAGNFNSAGSAGSVSGTGGAGSIYGTDSMRSTNGMHRTDSMFSTDGMYSTGSMDSVDNTRFFLNYYLPVLIKIIRSYRDIEREIGGRGISEGSLDAAKKAKKNIENLVIDAETAFQKHLKSILDNRIIDVTAEINVFKNSLVEDGYLDAGEVKSSMDADEVKSSMDADAVTEHNTELDSKENVTKSEAARKLNS